MSEDGMSEDGMSEDGMSENGYIKQVTQTVSASPHQVFALLSDPQRHADIDGSGTVVSVQQSAGPLRVGSTFDMRMKHGYSYRTRNTVLEFDADRLIAWRTRPLTRPLSWLIGGRIWRWELSAAGAGTRVTGTWDLRPERKRAVVRRLAGDPAASMRGTVERIEQLLTEHAPK